MVELIGKIFGRLSVIEELPKRGKNRYFKCVCECGNFTETQYGGLTSGSSRSCGCRMKEISSIQGKKNSTHGMRKTKIYSVWNAIKNRCHNQSSKSYPDYGGRGIKVCDKWVKSFEQFVSDMGIPENGMQIDRIDNNGNYCKENCRWVSRMVNARNKRNSVYIMFRGEPTHIEDVSKCINIKSNTLRARIRGGNFSECQVVSERLHAKPSLRCSD